MGRKKIEIKHIDTLHDRKKTFKKRRVGLLKKAHELATLCGINVSLCFTDLSNNFHLFSTSEEFKVSVGSSFNCFQNEFKILKYTTSEYPLFNTKHLSTPPLEKDDVWDFIHSNDQILGKRSHFLSDETQPAISCSNSSQNLSSDLDSALSYNNLKTSGNEFWINEKCQINKDSTTNPDLSKPTIYHSKLKSKKGVILTPYIQTKIRNLLQVVENKSLSYLPNPEWEYLLCFLMIKHLTKIYLDGKNSLLTEALRKIPHSQIEYLLSYLIEIIDKDQESFNMLDFSKEEQSQGGNFSFKSFSVFKEESLRLTKKRKTNKNLKDSKVVLQETLENINHILVSVIIDKIHAGPQLCIKTLLKQVKSPTKYYAFKFHIQRMLMILGVRAEFEDVFQFSFQKKGEKEVEGEKMQISYHAREEILKNNFILPISPKTQILGSNIIIFANCLCLTTHNYKIYVDSIKDKKGKFEATAQQKQDKSSNLWNQSFERDMLFPAF